MNQLERYGWSDYFAEQWAAGTFSDLAPARVTADFGSLLKVVMPQEKSAEIAGKLQHFAESSALPKVGDWVAVRPGDDRVTIEAVLPRQSEISRNAAGERAEKQVMAANVDIAFVLQALDHDFNPKRLQRYLYQLTAGNIRPILVLNKADKVADTAPYIAQMTPLNIPFIVCSALNGSGVEAISAAMKPGETAVLLGSSGVGKSTLANQLLGEQTQKTQEIRESDSTGRHTTTHRELFVLPGGGLLIDTPGIRELQLWGTEEELNEKFADIIELAGHCKYSNCRHGSEADCQIQVALKNGTLAREHYQNYQKMKLELQDLAAKTTVQSQRKNKKPRETYDENELY